MTHSLEIVSLLCKRLQTADAQEFEVLERSLSGDTRIGIQKALSTARRRIELECAETERLEKMYSYQESLSPQKIIIGLDEVGRGPLAGPLSVGAVVLPDNPRILGLNDSKKVPAHKRREIAMQIKEVALGWTVEHIEPDVIDATGLTASLRVAFIRAIRFIESKGIIPEAILLDGYPLHLDDREISVIRGDGCCASIAAASIVAKVERDQLMVSYADQYPQYGFEKSKGYASAEHIEAIKAYGLSPLHRKSFCTAYIQETLF